MIMLLKMLSIKSKAKLFFFLRAYSAVIEKKINQQNTLLNIKLERCLVFFFKECEVKRFRIGRISRAAPLTRLGGKGLLSLISYVDMCVAKGSGF